MRIRTGNRSETLTCDESLIERRHSYTTGTARTRVSRRQLDVSLDVNPEIIMCIMIKMMLHHAQLLGNNVCNWNEGPALISRPYLPSLVMKMFENTQSNLDVVDMTKREPSCNHVLVKLLVKVRAANNTVIGEFMENLARHAFDIHDFCREHDGIGFHQLREQLVQLLSSTPSSGMEQARNIKFGNTI